LALTEKVVRFRVVLESFQTMMAASVSELCRAGLMLDIFGFDSKLQSTSQTALSDLLHKPPNFLPNNSSTQRLFIYLLFIYLFIIYLTLYIHG